MTISSLPQTSIFRMSSVKKNKKKTRFSSVSHLSQENPLQMQHQNFNILSVSLKKKFLFSDSTFHFLPSCCPKECKNAMRLMRWPPHCLKTGSGAVQWASLSPFNHAHNLSNNLSCHNGCCGQILSQIQKKVLCYHVWEIKLKKMSCLGPKVKFPFIVPIEF